MPWPYTYYFCANPDCELHVIPPIDAEKGMPRWATTATGITTSRIAMENVYFCDCCARTRIRSNDPVKPDR